MNSTIIPPQLFKATGLEDLKEELFEYFEETMAPDIIELQGGTAIGAAAAGSPEEPFGVVNTLDDVGREIVQCCSGLEITEVGL